MEEIRGKYSDHRNDFTLCFISMNWISAPGFNVRGAQTFPEGSLSATALTRGDSLGTKQCLVRSPELRDPETRYQLAPLPRKATDQGTATFPTRDPRLYMKGQAQ